MPVTVEKVRYEAHLAEVCRAVEEDPGDYMRFVVLLVPQDPSNADSPLAIHTDLSREELAYVLAKVTKTVRE